MGFATNWVNLKNQIVHDREFGSTAEEEARDESINKGNRGKSKGR
jgi:hypothetical protein